MNVILCSLCYDAASKAGRPVMLTDQYEYPVCNLCESRLRNGLVHYIPSNGTEGMMFNERCADCRHCSHTADGFATCAWKVLDQVLESGWTERDSAKRWYDPAVLKTQADDGHPLCPAECLKFTHKRDGDGAFRDPPPKDCIGQMFFEDIIVPKEASARERRNQEIPCPASTAENS